MSRSTGLVVSRSSTALALGLASALVGGGGPCPALAMMAAPTSPSSRQALALAAASQPGTEYLKGCYGFDCVERYIDAPDDAFAWHEQPAKLLSGTSSRGVKWTGHVLEMTSQRWLGPKDTSHQLWTHPMLVVLPDGWNGSSSKGRDFASILVGGANQTFSSLAGGFDTSSPDVRAVVELATRTGAPAALMSLVPNQAISFSEDPAHEERIEDQIKAYTWRHFLEHPDDPTWLLELPDAKASVRAMDTVAAFLGRDDTRFGVSGCSKRAVAAIMACAHDSRCELLVPCAMVGNMLAHADKAGKAYGGRVWISADYDQVDVSKDLLAAAELIMITDPISSFPKLTMPKLWLSTTNDDFFLLDHTESFWSELPGPKYFFMRPNSPHSASIADAHGGDGFIAPVAAFVSAHLTGEALPQLEWHFNSSSSVLSVRQLEGRAPAKALVWSGRTCQASGRRDFRLVTADQGEACLACGQPVQGPRGHMLYNVSRSTVWSSRELQPSGEGLWEVHEPEPTEGWAAFYVSFEFPSPGGQGDPLQLTTEAFVVPYNKYPFAVASDKLV